MTARRRASSLMLPAIRSEPALATTTWCTPSSCIRRATSITGVRSVQLGRRGRMALATVGSWSGTPKITGRDLLGGGRDLGLWRQGMMPAQPRQGHPAGDDPAQARPGGGINGGQVDMADDGGCEDDPGQGVGGAR